MTFDDWTDPEINKAVALSRGYLVKTEFHLGKIGFTEKYHRKYHGTIWIWAAKTDEHGCKCECWEQFNCCRDPLDSWTIITENKIAIQPRATSDEWFSFSTCENEFEYIDKNPLRAAMIVYLMMKGVKPEDKP